MEKALFYEKGALGKCHLVNPEKLKKYCPAVIQVLETGDEPWKEILHDNLPDPRNKGNIQAATFKIDSKGRSIRADCI